MITVDEMEVAQGKVLVLDGSASPGSGTIVKLEAKFSLQYDSDSKDSIQLIRNLLEAIREVSEASKKCEDDAKKARRGRPSTP